MTAATGVIKTLEFFLRCLEKIRKNFMIVPVFLATVWLTFIQPENLTGHMNQEV